MAKEMTPASASSTRSAKKKGLVVMLVGVALLVSSAISFFLLPQTISGFNGFNLMLALIFLIAGALTMRKGKDIINEGEYTAATTAIAERKKTTDKQISDFVIPILKKKGEVSVHDIATHMGSDVASTKNYVARMVNDGYFEDAYLKGGLLVKETPVSCEYCKAKISPSDKRCPNCGAVVKK